MHNAVFTCLVLGGTLSMSCAYPAFDAGTAALGGVLTSGGTNKGSGGGNTRTTAVGGTSVAGGTLALGSDRVMGVFHHVGLPWRMAIDSK